MPTRRGRGIPGRRSACNQAARPKAPDIDRVLHAERLNGRGKRLHDLASPAADLPNGAMIFQDGAPHLVLNGLARRWSLRGHGAPTAPVGGALLITPSSTVAAPRAGYQTQLHASAWSGSNPDSAG